jgi:hypothetical protein
MQLVKRDFWAEYPKVREGFIPEKFNKYRRKKVISTGLKEV